MERGWILQNTENNNNNLLFNNNKLCGEVIHWLDEQYSETGATKIGTCNLKNLDFSQHDTLSATCPIFVCLFVFSSCYL